MIKITSSKVKNRYNKKTYTNFKVCVKKDIAEQYKKKCEENGVTYSKCLHTAIENYLKD